MRYLKWFFSGEVLFAGFLTSSVFKALFPNFIDLTFVFMVLTFLVAIKRISFKKTLPKNSLFPLIAYALLVVLMAVSLVYTTTEAYSFDKIFRFSTIVAWTFLGTFLLMQSKESVKRFLQGLLFFSVFTSVLTLQDYFSGQVASIDRLGVEGGNVLGLGRITGMSVILISALYLYDKSNLKVKLIALVGLAISITTLFLTGSRMPLIAAFISLLFLIVISFKFSLTKNEIRISKRLFYFIGISTPFVILLLFLSRDLFKVMFARLSSFFSSTGDASAEAREGLISIAVNMFADKPFVGQGIGSFPTFYAGIDSKIYPHNIFFEVLSELGLIGVILLLSLFGYALLVVLLYTHKHHLNIYQTSIIMLAIFYFVNAQTTGDINDNRILFSFIALLCMIPFYKDKQRKVEIPDEIKVVS